MGYQFGIGLIVHSLYTYLFFFLVDEIIQTPQITIFFAIVLPFPTI